MHSNSQPARTPRPAVSAIATIRCSWCRGESSRNGGANSARKTAESSANGYGRPDATSTSAGWLPAPAGRQTASSAPHHWMASMKLQPSSKARRAALELQPLAAEYAGGVEDA